MNRKKKNEDQEYRRETKSEKPGKLKNGKEERRGRR